MLFSRVMELFLKHIEMIGRSPETIKHYKQDLQNFYNYLCKNYNRPVYIDEVSKDDIEKYLFNMLTGSGHSSYQRHNVLTAIRSLYNFCTLKKICITNRAKMVKYEKVENKERTYISEIELERIVRGIKNPTVKALLQTIFYTGLRISESINLRIDDVDFEHEFLKVREGKGKKERVIPINDKLKRIMEGYLKNGRLDTGSNRFFSCRSGGISKEHICDLLKESVLKSGISKGVTPHILRHSFASNLINRGVDLLRVQKLLGHESLVTTSIYLHTNMDDLEKAVNMI